eukprot:2311800-Prymnesium_polylepis.1
MWYGLSQVSIGPDRRLAGSDGGANALLTWILLTPRRNSRGQRARLRERAMRVVGGIGEMVKA